jgi:serine/threonine protein phosphatase 1
MAGRTVAIGDVHGCSVALAALLGALGPTANDTIVTLGDYIDCGPDSRGVLDQLLALGERCRLVPLLGNHEEMLLGALRDRSMLKNWLDCGGVETLASYGLRPTGFAPGYRLVAILDALEGPLPDFPRRGFLAGQRLADLVPREHWAFLARCLPYHETESHLFVHASYHPNLPLD